MYFPLKEFDTTPNCPDCGGDGVKNITCQILRDEPVWLDDGVRNAIQDMDDPATRPITNRSEYKQHLKENGIIEKG